MHPDIAQALLDYLSEFPRYHAEDSGLTQTNRLRALGFDSIDEGAFKVVYGSTDYGIVVKLIDDEQGANELSNYDDAPPHIQSWLVPIIVEDYSIQVQEFLHEHNSKSCYQCNCALDECHLGTDVFRGKNHRHRMDGTPAIYDYGQYDMWDCVDKHTSDPDRDHERSYEQSEAA